MRVKRDNIMADIIIDKAKQMEEVRRMRAFVREKLYPALIETSTSIDDAKFLLGSFGNMIMQEFLAIMKEKKLSELKLVDKLDPNSPQYQGYKKIVELFDEENVFNARELVDGMKNEITMMVDNELKGRKLDTLKTNFLE
jgi:hypothetical protein